MTIAAVLLPLAGLIGYFGPYSDLMPVSVPKPWSHVPQDHWIGMKFLCRNCDGDKHVKLQLYVTTRQPTIRTQNGKLLLNFAGFTTPLTHWHNESFYIRSPSRSTYDWLLTFASADAKQPASLVVKHIGWDKSEPDHIFRRWSHRPSSRQR